MINLRKLFLKNYSSRGLSVEAEPSNEMLSVAKVITWSDPAIATGGLLTSSPSSFAFLQEKNISATEMDNDKRRNIFFKTEI